MSLEYPMVSEFRADSPKCAGKYNGCAVAATEAILRRYMPGISVPAQVQLGKSMGQRHPGSGHGHCPHAWCPYCSYRELKARNVPVGYGRIDIGEFRKKAAARHAMHMGGWYHSIHLVSPTSYSKAKPAEGRSDNTGEGKFFHSIVVWRVGSVAKNGRPATYIVSDPDFQSKARPTMPPYCVYEADEVEAMYLDSPIKFSVAYCTKAPPALAPIIKKVAKQPKKSTDEKLCICTCVTD